MSGIDRRKLFEELKRFSGFLHKSEVGPLIKSAFSSLETSDSESSNKDNDFIVAQAISILLSSKETQDKVNNILHISMNLIITGYFSLKSVIEILKGIENYTVTDSTTGLKILQFVSTSLPDYFKSLSATCSLFSIALSLINNKIQLVSNTAFATSQQMISSLFQIIKNYIGKPPKITMMQLDKLVTKEYLNPLYKYPHLLLSDLSRILWQKETKWLHTLKLEVPIAINLWKIIMTSQKEFIISENGLSDIIADSMIMPPTDLIYIYIYSTFINNYSGTYNKLTEEIMKYFLQYCKPNTEYTVESLSFFYSIFLEHPNLIELLEKSDPECTITESLLEQLNNFKIENPNQTINFSTIYSKPTHTDFLVAAPINIGLIISKIPNKTLLTKSWRQIVFVIIKAIRYTSLQSIDLVFESVFILLKNMDRCDVLDGLGSTVRILCSLASKQRLLRENPDPTEVVASEDLHTNKTGLLFKRKRIICMQMLKKALTEQPTVFRKKYARILSTIAPSQIDSDFSLKLPDAEFEKFCSALVVNADGYRLELLGRILASNSERSTRAITIIQHSIFEAALSKPSETAVFLDRISEKCHNDVGFVIELSMRINKTDKNVQVKCLNSVLKMIQINLNQSFSVENWNTMIKLCSENLKADDVISASFSLFQILVSNYLEKIPQECILECLRTSFSFISQTANNNISISSIGLTEKLSARFGEEAWEEFSKISIKFTNYENTEISKKVIETALNLFIDNNYDFIIFDIEEMLKHYSTTPSLWEQHSNILSNIAHFVSLNYNKIADNQNLTKMLLNALTTLQESCTDGQTNVYLLDFYKALLENKRISITQRREIYQQFTSIIEFYVAHETADYLVLECIGSKISELLISEKEFIDEATADIWFPAIDKLSLSLDSEIKIHPTVFQVLNVLPEICVTCGVIFKACYHLTLIITKTESKNVRTVACQISSTILETKVSDSFVVSFMQSMTPALGFDEALPIIRALLTRQLDLSQSESESLFATLKGAVGSPELTQRLVSMFPSISTGAQLSFVQSSSDENAQLLVWQKYCDPGSPKFDRRIANNCMETVLDNIEKCLRESRNEEQKLLKILQFLSSHGVVPHKVGNHVTCRTWHIIRFVPQLISMLNDERKEVSDIAQKLLFDLHKDFGRIIGEEPQ